LTDEINKKVKDYSLGNKRKLSVALAFIGSPQIVLLDEPSSGMDPSMRRTLWNEITKLREDRVVILTTHSMEEADALCSRIGILTNGELKCVGSSQHLKNKFGGGYIFSLIGNEEKIDAIEDWIHSKFKNVKIINKLGGTIVCEIETQNELWKIFELIEASRQDLNILDYSISQTTLEQVFLNFSKDQM
jgi:ATP-binding cassette, subfamily A (ABC1), member 3